MKKSSILAVLIAFALTLSSTFASTSAHAAAGGMSGGGGNDVGALFTAAATTAIKNVDKDSVVFAEVKGVDLAATLAGARVLVSSTPLFVKLNGVKQPSAALNYHHPDTIVVDAALWKAIASEPARETVALHEVLSLAGLESTGDYHISQRYLLADGFFDSIDRDGCRRIPKEYMLMTLRINKLVASQIDVARELINIDGSIGVCVFAQTTSGINYIDHFTVSPVGDSPGIGSTFDCLVNSPPQQQFGKGLTAPDECTITGDDL